MDIFKMKYCQIQITYHEGTWPLLLLNKYSVSSKYHHQRKSQYHHFNKNCVLTFHISFKSMYI
jgi:hypothetical protein